MRRATTASMNAGTKQDDLTKGNACWETPRLVFAKLNADFGPFDLDLTADAHRHLCADWFGPNSPFREFDALVAAWHTHGYRGYSNPPYGPFVQKLYANAILPGTVPSSDPRWVLLNACSNDLGALGHGW